MKLKDVVIFETLDALSNQIKDENVRLETIDLTKRNPATGPIYVENVEPGDTLVVEILDVAPSERGWIRVYPGGGVLHDKLFKPKVKLLHLENETVKFNNIGMPIKPMIGVLGVAPSEGEFPTITPSYHGGNMDVALITKGSKVYLPVFVEGALLALGDLHAVQGDGEICSTAVEISGEVKIRLDVIKGMRPKYPIVELEDSYSIVTFGHSLDDALYRASEEVVKSLMRAHGLEFEEAYMLSSLIVNLRVNQAVNPMRGIRAEIPKKYVKLNDLLNYGQSP